MEKELQIILFSLLELTEEDEQIIKDFLERNSLGKLMASYIVLPITHKSFEKIKSLNNIVKYMENKV